LYRQTNKHFRHPSHQRNFVHFGLHLDARQRGIDLLDLERLDRPILLSVVQNRPIGAEFAHFGTRDDALLQPLALIQVLLIDQFESVNVGLEVFCEQVVVVVANGVQQRLVDLTVTKLPGGDLVQYMGEGRTLLLDGDGVVSVLVSEVFHGRSQMTEEEDVLISNLLSDLDIRTITVPTNNPPFKQNFMFEVPLASVPAVEIC